MRIENDEITFSLGASSSQPALRWQLLEGDRYRWPARTTYSHPDPPFNRLFFMIAGSAEVKCHGQTGELVAGRIYLLPTGFSFDVTYEQGTEFCFFHFVLTDPIGMDALAGGGSLAELDDRRLFDEVIDNYAQVGGEAGMRWRLAVFQVACRFLAMHPPTMDAMQATVRYRELLEYVHANCSATLTVDHLARQFGVSRSALSKGFHRATRVALKDHLVAMLLRRVKERLAHSDDVVKEIAVDLGFSDVSYLFRFFKKHTRQTPAEYRATVNLPKENARLNLRGRE